MLQDGGTFLVAIDDSVHHNLSLWDWQKGDKGSKITETKVNIRQREESIPEPLILLGESSERSIKRPPPPSRDPHAGGIRRERNPCSLI